MRRAWGVVVFMAALAVTRPSGADDGPTIKEQVWARGLAERLGLPAVEPRRSVVDDPPGTGVGVELRGLSARRLRFAAASAALTFARKGLGKARGLAFVEARGKEVLLLRGPVLEDPARAALARSAGWEALPDPGDVELLAVTRDGGVATSGRAADGAAGTPALAEWLQRLASAGAPRQKAVLLEGKLKKGERARHELGMIPGGFWYAFVQGDDGCDLDLRLATESARWTSQSHGPSEELLAPAERPLRATIRHASGPLSAFKLYCIPVAPAAPLVARRRLDATFDRQVLPLQLHAVDPQPGFAVVRLSAKEAQADLDLVLCDQELRPVSSAIGPGSDHALVVPPGPVRRWLQVRSPHPQAASPYSLSLEPVGQGAAALAIGEAPLEAALPAGAADVFFRLRPASSGIITLRLEADEGDLDLAVFGPDGAARTATALDATEEVAINGRSETDYLVRVSRGRRPPPQGGKFTLRAESLVAERLAKDGAGGPKLWALFVGIAAYERLGNDLHYTRGDALALYNDLRRQRLAGGEPAVEPSRSIVLLDERATTDVVRRAFEALARRADPDDILLFFFSGHGTRELRDGALQDPKDEADGLDEALACHDKDGLLSDDELRRLLDAVPCRRQVLLIDACHSGGLAEVALARPGRLGILSSLEEQTSTESGAYEAGLLTAVLQLGLGGEADQDRDGAVSATELAAFVRRDLPRRCTVCGAGTMPDDRECGRCDADLTQAGNRQVPVIVDRLGEPLILARPEPR